MQGKSLVTCVVIFCRFNTKSTEFQRYTIAAKTKKLESTLCPD